MHCEPDEPERVMVKSVMIRNRGTVSAHGSLREHSRRLDLKQMTALDNRTV